MKKTLERPPLAAQIRRFPGGNRRLVHDLAMSRQSLGDLAYVFPGALFAIVCASTEGKSCDEAIALAASGAALRDVAKALDLPMWLRRLPPEAFANWRPPAPGGEAFGRKIAQYIPANADFSPFWLGAVLEAAALAGDDFALWVAKRISPPMQDMEGHPFAPLGLFAWYSGHRRSRIGALIKHPFTTSMSLETAISAAEEWFININLELYLPISRPAGMLWTHGGITEGLRFVPLITARDLRAEAAVMNNCLRRYARAVADRDCLLFSIRRGNRHVAVVKIEQHPRSSSMPVIDDLKGPGNAVAPPQVWRAAYIWLGHEIGAGRLNFDDMASDLNSREVSRMLLQRRKDWRSMTLPYLRAKSHLQRTAKTAGARQRYRSAIKLMRADHGLSNLESELVTLSSAIGRTSRLTYGI